MENLQSFYIDRTIGKHSFLYIIINQSFGKYASICNRLLHAIFVLNTYYALTPRLEASVFKIKVSFKFDNFRTVVTTRADLKDVGSCKYLPACSKVAF